VYYVDSEGACVDGRVFCVGSGAPLAYAVLDEEWAALQAPDCSLSEAVRVAQWAVRHAGGRDGYSGGYVNVVRVNATGCFHLTRTDSRDLSPGRRHPADGLRPAEEGTGE
jgi:20S proteasome alpha/beta subunit